jgi:lactoylglutathione lyase
MIETSINIDVDNLERAIEFYTNAFGLQLGRRFDDSAAEMLGASSKIYLLSKPAGSPASPSIPQKRDYRRHWTPVHINFVVDDINAAVEKAKTAGAKLEGDINTYKWGHIAYMSDPFGHGFCLIEFIGSGYDEIVG